MFSHRHAVAILAALLLAAPALADGPLRVGSVAASRFGSDWTLDGPMMANTRAKLLNTSNFGLAGTVRRPIQITDTAATVGSVDAPLLGNFDVFFIGSLDDQHPNAFTPEEMAAFQAWVAAGGTMIVTCDAPYDDALCAAFGLPVDANSTAPAVPTAPGADHPLFAGPFGAVASLGMWGDYGYFAGSVGAVVLAQDSSGSGALPVVLFRRWGSGRLILLSDVDILAQAATAGSSVTSDNDRFLGNLFAFAARPFDLLIDAAAHTGGLNGTTWRSDVDLLNTGSGDVTVAVSQLKANQGNIAPIPSLVSVPAGRTLRLSDVLAGLFTGANAALGLSFPGGQLYADSRFYNVGAADGSVYGMYIPSSDDRDTVWHGRPAVFHHLSYTPGTTAGARVNIGGASRVPFPSTVVIKLYGDVGELLGTKTYTFQPYEHRQFTKIHEALATPAVTHGYATVEVTTAGGAVDMYAMLIENLSGDPIFMPPSFSSDDAEDAVLAVTAGGAAAAPVAPGPCTGDYQRIIAAAANTGGINLSKWQTDVDLLNLGVDDATVEIARLTANQANTAPLITSVSVPSLGTLRLVNILDTLLPATNAGLGFRFCSGEAFVNSRFYNIGSADGKVYGMYVPSMAPEQSATPCRPAVFHHLSYSPDTATGQRVNIGATNGTGIKTTWVIRLFGDNGTLLGTHTATLQPFEHHQYTNIHKILGTPAVTHGWATVEVTTPGAAIHPYAMRIENVGGDPIYMPAELEQVATSPELAAAFAGTWTGQWKNTTFGTTGNASLALSMDLPAQSVSAVVDLDGNVFGAGAPPAQTLTGTFTEKGIVFSGTSPLLGTYALNADGFCSVSGRLTHLSNPTISSVDLAGTVTTTKVSLTYTITFSPAGGGGTATGTVTLTK